MKNQLLSMLGVNASLLSDPRRTFSRVATRLGYTPIENIELDCLLPEKPSGGPRLVHVATYTDWNAGDTLLTSVLRDLVMHQCGPAEWTGFHSHRPVSPGMVAYMNRSAGVIIGGGGLFLRDTNPNVLSGWQWSCSVDALRRLRVPLAIFAVGYNRFRNQPDFEPVFREHLRLTAEKATFVGLRNSGSIRAIRGYLPEELHGKLRFQPCMTTLVSRLYPHRMIQAEPETPFVALNCAFDRAGLRFGDRQDQILADIAEAMWRISRQFKVKHYAHSQSDETILPYLDRRGVPYENVRLEKRTAAEVVEAYASPALTIGMRGHAQMIPFGCRRPILSLISHDKLRWFLEDIDAEDWGVDVGEPELADRLSQTAFDLLDRATEVRERIDLAQARLWEITVNNLRNIATDMGLNPPPRTASHPGAGQLATP